MHQQSLLSQIIEADSVTYAPADVSHALAAVAEDTEKAASLELIFEAVAIEREFNTVTDWLKYIHQNNLEDSLEYKAYRRNFCDKVPRSVKKCGECEKPIGKRSPGECQAYVHQD